MNLSTLFHAFSIEAAVVTWLITIVRVLVESSATLLAGIICAAIIRCSGGYPALQTWLGPPRTIERTFRVMCACCCIPLCAFGVLPVAKELADTGMPRRDLAVLWLTAPLLNPLSLLYAVSILPGWQFGVFLLVACTLGVVIAEVADRFAPDETPASHESMPPRTEGTTRLYNGAIAVGRIATGWSLLYVMAGVLITGITISFVPPATFERVFAVENSVGPLESMAMVAPQMITPITFTMAASGILQMHLSFACAIVLQLLGVAWCGGTFLAMQSIWGWRRTLGLFCVTLLLAASIGYGAHAVCPPAVGEAEETHGLDTLARPHHANFAQASSSLDQQLNHTDAIMRGGMIFLLLIIGWGFLVRAGRFQYRSQPESSVTKAKPQSGWNVELSPGQIGVASMAVVAFSCVMIMYAIFPSVGESFEEMRNLQTDAVVAVKNSKTEQANQKLAQWDTVAARLPVGWVLRFGVPSSDQTSQIRKMRELLWSIRREMGTPNFDERSAREKADQLVEQFQACREVCLGATP